MPVTPPSKPAHPHARSTRKHNRWGTAVLYFFLPVGVFILTSLPFVNRVTPIVALGLLTFIVSARFVPRRVPRSLIIIGWVGFVVTLVGSSGWFFSPFFFGLYLAAIALGFIYSPLVAVGFTLGLIVIFASSIGEVSPTADFLTLLSLLSVIPITIILRKSFLLVQQERKGILILEPDEKNADLTSLDSVLTNQVNKIAIVLRQPITYIRQGLALLKDNALSDDEYPEVITRMSSAADEVFTLIKEFETETTKNKLISRKAEIHDEE